MINEMIMVGLDRIELIWDTNTNCGIDSNSYENNADDNDNENVNDK